MHVTEYVGKMPVKPHSQTYVIDIRACENAGAPTAAEGGHNLGHVSEAFYFHALALISMVQYFDIAKSAIERLTL